MAIKNIYFENFKCFEKVDVGLGKFNIIIGPNASGKSSFIQILKFLKDFNDYGLDNAISLQGGVEYFRNINIGRKRNFIFRIKIEGGGALGGAGKDNPILIERKGIEYELEINFPSNSKKYKVVHENVIQNVLFHKFNKSDKKLNATKNLGVGKIVATRDGVKFNRNFDFPSNLGILPDDLNPQFFNKITVRPDESFFSFPFIMYPFPFDLFDNIKIYDFDPRLSKRAIPFTGRNELLEDGGNLTITLNTLFKNRQNKKKFLNLVRDVLPFFNDTKTEKLTDKSYIFTLKEGYLKNSNKYLPSSFLSDGTINVIALIIALFFQRNDIIAILEEPERNLHPSLISKIIALMKEASKRKQIIITTHNPEILRHCDLNDMLFVKRDKQGFASIIKPSEREHIKEFLKNDVGIDELFIQNLIH